MWAQSQRCFEQADPEEPMEFARTEQITQIVLGSSQRSRWQEIVGGGSIVRRVQRMAGAAGIDVHTIARREIPYLPGDAEIASHDG